VAPLLTLSRLIDRCTAWVGRWVAWLVLAAVLISALNAAVRKLFNYSSNAYLEIQWYLFAAVFLLAAGYTLMRQEHVKIDVSGRFTKRTRSGSTSSASSSSSCRWSIR
jgi:TRAP-type mannitol/chloroaromatic compound transport system permease small subunit